MSAIPKATVHDGPASEDNQDVKTFLEDLKSSRNNSPLEVRERQESNRIIEENEDDSSSEAEPRVTNRR